MEILHDMGSLSQDIIKVLAYASDEDLERAFADSGLVGRCARAEMNTRYPYFVLFQCSHSGASELVSDSAKVRRGFESAEAASKFISERIAKSKGELCPPNVTESQVSPESIEASMGCRVPNSESERYFIIEKA